MRASLHPFCLPLRAPLRLAFGTLTERTGVLLRLETGGHVGWGEASPLAGYSPDTLDAATRALAAWTPGTPTCALPPSARAAADGACWELEAARTGTPLAALCSRAPSNTLALAALLTGDLETVVSRATAVRAQGYGAAKLKVGGRAHADDVARVRAVHAALGPDVALRLDANRAWTYNEARQFARAVDGMPLALLEEPLADPARLADLAATTALPIGLDESLVAMTPAQLGAHAYACALVLKPTLLGGVQACVAWAGAARACGMAVIVSSAFESGVGTRQAVALAAALGPEPAGLDPYTHLAADVLAPPLRLDTAQVSVADVLAPRRVRV